MLAKYFTISWDGSTRIEDCKLFITYLLHYLILKRIFSTLFKCAQYYCNTESRIRPVQENDNIKIDESV